MKVVISVLVVVVVVGGALLALPFMIDLNKYQDQYKPLIEDALNRKVQLQDIRLTIWPRIGARVAGFAILDDPAFGSNPFFSLTSLDIGVKLMPLLGGTVEVEDITLLNPVITAIKNRNGVLNISTIGRAGVQLPTTPSRAPVPSAEGPLKILALLSVDRVSLIDGTLTYRDLSATEPAEYVLQNMALLLRSVHLGQTPSLHFNILIQPFNLPVRLDGTFGPLKDTTDIDAFQLQLALGKNIFNITGSTAGHDAKININSPVINTANLPIALPLKNPIELKNVAIAAAIKGQDAHLNSLSFQLFEGQVQGQGNLTSGSDSPAFTAKTTIEDLQLGSAMEALGTTHISISGTAGADLMLQGRGFSMPDLTKSLEGTSHITVKDGKIEGMNLLQETISILKVAGISLDSSLLTAFSTIETDLAIKDGIINVRRLLMDGHDFQAMGNGTIGFDQALHLNVRLNLSPALSQKIAGASSAAKFALTEERMTVPLFITGTVHAPSYELDANSLTDKVQEQVKEKVEEVLSDLLKGSAKPDDLRQKSKDLLKGLLKR
jgi:AsmA protein